MTGREFKVPPKRIPSDGCVITIGAGDGERKVAVHAGEWIEIIPIVTVGELLTLTHMRLEDNLSEKTALRGISEMCEQLARRIVAWNWTDMAGNPLPCPYGKPEILKLLSREELFWLVNNGLNPETETERKNA